MRFVVITLFPEFIRTFAETSIVSRAIAKKAVSVDVVNLRDFALDNYGTVDDKPYGGGAGMLLRPEPLSLALEKAREILPRARVVFLTPQGAPLDHGRIKDLSESSEKDFIIVCGHYKGVDERIRSLKLTPRPAPSCALRTTSPGTAAAGVRTPDRPGGPPLPGPWPGSRRAARRPRPGARLPRAGNRPR